MTAVQALDQVRDLLDDAEANDAIGRRLPDNRWTPRNQRRFLELVADGNPVEFAANFLGLSAQSAYALRRTARGQAFALGWRAASLIARDTVADRLLDRALTGQTETVTRADGSEITRFRCDNRLATTLLRRLDRQVEEATDADTAAARMVAGEFDAYLDIVGKDGGPARAGLFLARRTEGTGDARDLQPILALAGADRFVRTGAATAAEIATADLDPADRAGWSAEQWARADAAGLFAFAAPEPEAAAELVATPQPPQLVPTPPPEDEDEEEEEPVWWDDERGAWQTDLPPPVDFDGEEEGTCGEDDYVRDLSREEADLMDAWHAARRRAAAQAAQPRRLAWFARIAAQASAQDPDATSPQRCAGDPPDEADRCATGGGEAPMP